MNQSPSYDVHEHINTNIDAHDRIKNSRDTHYDAEMERRCQFDTEHGAPDATQAPLALGTPRLKPFMARLRAVQWPIGFKIVGVDTYDGKANPAQWLTLYEITVRAIDGSKDRMANYLPVMLN